MPERNCGVLHVTIAEAIEHAEKNLDFWRKPATEYWGTLKSNEGSVVGFQVTSRKRWRLDYDPDPKRQKWVHVNEENFDLPEHLQRVVHSVDSKNDLQVSLYYRKWTSKHNPRT